MHAYYVHQERMTKALSVVKTVYHSHHEAVTVGRVLEVVRSMATATQTHPFH